MLQTDLTSQLSRLRELIGDLETLDLTVKLRRMQAEASVREDDDRVEELRVEVESLAGSLSGMIYVVSGPAEVVRYDVVSLTRSVPVPVRGLQLDSQVLLLDFQFVNSLMADDRLAHKLVASCQYEGRLVHLDPMNPFVMLSLP